MNEQNYEPKMEALRGFLAGQGWAREAIDFVLDQFRTVHLADTHQETVDAMDFGERIVAYKKLGDGVGNYQGHAGRPVGLAYDPLRRDDGRYEQPAG